MSLSRLARGKPNSRIARLAQFFREHPHQWFDGARELATIGGKYPWRSRISDLRRSPYGYQIDNRQRSVRRPDGTSYTVSEYRYTPMDWRREEKTATGALTPVNG
jgi:hypothetical protein